jgi:hypothetical protein
MDVEGKDEISILSTGLNDMSTIEKEITKWLFEGTIEQAKYFYNLLYKTWVTD